MGEPHTSQNLAPSRFSLPHVRQAATDEANSDTNIFDGADPSKANYIGHHPGTAFLELQFYPPGWVPFQNAISCDATQWCAAMAIFSFNNDQNTGIPTTRPA
jgi:hypothetical protein